MKTLAEIKEFAAKSCKNKKYTYKLEVLPFMDGYYEGFKRGIEEYEKLIKEKNEVLRS